MPYIIDGHNLIGKLRGISLREMDDEMKLVELLQVFCRVKRKRVEVYFDGAPPGFARTKRFGQVNAYFIQARIGDTRLQADDAIMQRLRALKSKARNWVVVTSDRRIQAQAHESHARVQSSEDFANDLLEAQRLAFDLPADEGGREVSRMEVDYWLEEFNNRKHEN